MANAATAQDATPLLKAEEAAAFLRVHRCTLYALDLPYVLVGRRRRWRTEDLREWVLANRIPKETTP